MKRRGFTLIEILVVLAIIATLAALILPNLLSVERSSQETETQAIINSISINLASYESDFGDYPPSSLSHSPLRIKGGNKTNTGVECLVICLSTRNKKGPYMDWQESQLINLDKDALQKKPFNWYLGNKKLWEISDSWGNPLIYIHHRDYGKKFKYVDAEGNSFTVKAQKSKKLGTYFRPTTFQLWSIGPDMLNHNGGEDDVKNWKSDQGDEDEDDSPEPK